MVLNDLTIAKKTYFQGAIQLSLIFLVGAFSIFQMSAISKELKEIAERDIPLSGFVTRLTEHQLEGVILFERSLLYGVLSNNDGASRSKFEKTRNEVITLNEKIDKEFIEVNRFIKESIFSLEEENSKQQFSQFSKKLTRLQLQFEEVALRVDNILNKVSIGDETWKTETGGVETELDAIDKALVNLFEDIYAFTLATAEKVENDEVDAIRNIIVLFVISLIISVLIPTVIAKSITGPLEKLACRLNEVAGGDGDLTLMLDDTGRDETGRVAKSFNTFLRMLRGVISEAKGYASELEQSAKVTSSAMECSKSGVNKQQNEVELVATAVIQLNNSIDEIAETTDLASKEATQAKELVYQGRNNASTTKEIINQLVGEIEDASGVIQSLVTETDNIGMVLDTIQSIAEQTNLLALNAAIEAARAGDTGRGFAVVADEVRVLAQRTQESTVSIQDLVQRLQSEAGNAVTSMAKGKHSAERCMENSELSVEAFEEATGAVEKIDQLNTTIAVATQEQSNVARDLSGTVQNIQSIAQSTSDNVFETAKVNVEVVENVDKLHSNLSTFKV